MKPGSLTAKVLLSSLFAVAMLAEAGAMTDVSAARSTPSALAQKGPVQLAWLDGATWYAIAGSHRTKREAEAQAQRLGDPWHVQNSDICENFTKGLWVVVAGAYDAASAKELAAPVGAYVKECK